MLHKSDLLDTLTPKLEEDKNESILALEDIPTTITKLRRYFKHIFQNEKVSVVNPGVVIDLDRYRENL